MPVFSAYSAASESGRKSSDGREISERSSTERQARDLEDRSRKLTIEPTEATEGDTEKSMPMADWHELLGALGGCQSIDA